jgi:hypothetical protein
MLYEIMKKLGLNVTRPYQSVYAMDYRKLEVHGPIKDLLVHLEAYLDRVFVMDEVIPNVRKAWGMLLSNKWMSMLGGNIQLDLSYTTIPFDANQYVILKREQWE